MANVQRIGRGRPGRKFRSAEPRPATTFKLVKSHRDRYEEIAQHLEIPLGDYLSWALAKAHEYPTPDYLQYVDDLVANNGVRTQEPLPLAMEA